MSKILCYGDSNTWGYVPNADVRNNPDERYDENTRWPAVLQKFLGEKFTIIEQGLNGRTTNVSGSLKIDEGKNGLISFTQIFSDELPVNILILQLGTNDLKERFDRSAEEITNGVEEIVKETFLICKERNSNVPKIIILSPPLVDEANVKPPYQMNGALEKSKSFAKYFHEVAERNSCLFIDLAKYIESSSVDAIHLDSNSHLKIAELLVNLINSIES